MITTIVFDLLSTTILLSNVVRQPSSYGACLSLTVCIVISNINCYYFIYIIIVLF